MSPIFIFINGCLFVSAVLFFVKHYRAYRRRKKQNAKVNPAVNTARRAIGETPMRKNAGRADLVLHYPPAHFDGGGYNTERAFDRESILFSLTRNHTLAVVKPHDEE